MTERRWMGNDGKYEVYASYVCLFQDKKVKLRKPNGALIAVPLNVLCDADIAYITTQSKSLIQHDSAISSSLSKISSNTSSIESVVPTPSIVQRMNSDQLIPKQSLSTIADQFKRHQDNNNSKGFHNLPTRVLVRIFAFLDVHSRLELAAVSKRCRQIVLHNRDIWKSIHFLGTEHYRVTDVFMYQLVVFLQFKRDVLHKSIEHVLLDGTVITTKTVVLLIKNLSNLKTLSLKSCWQVMTYELAVELTSLQNINTSITQVNLGKVLHRGTITPSSAIDSKSFGQDVWYINTALNKLANRNVQIDIALCSACHLGAASQEFYCSSCGFLPLKKCIACAPKCDRCGVQTCGMNTCLDPKLKVQLAKCGRCEQPLGICNNERSPLCQKARRPCPHCHRLFHVQCRLPEGTYKSNQCSKCGTTCCPHCELVSCSGGCHGQWCKKCVPSLGYCKCIVIKSSTISKRYVCVKCQKLCTHCDATHFCKRCLRVHLEMKQQKKN